MNPGVKMLHTPPFNPDIKHELKNQLLHMTPRGFELFAGEFLVYVGLEKVSVTRYIGDGGIDAEGDLIASPFRIPVGVQVKRYRKNVQRTDIDKFIGALSGRFSEGLFVTTANYGATASKKASSSIPRVLTLSGDQVISIMLENKLGLKLSHDNAAKLRIDPDYFEAFEARKQLLNLKLQESRQAYSTGSGGNNSSDINDTNTINLNPEEDLISVNALGYALRIDPNTLRRWIENGKLQADVSQIVRERSNYYVRRDRIERIREELNLQARPVSSDEWRQEFLDYAKSRNLSKSYKPVLVKALFKLVDREGKAKMVDIVKEFRAFYIQRATSGLDVEFGVPLLQDPTKAGDKELRRLIIQMPLERFRIKNYFEYNENDDTVQIAPQLWQELRYYEIMDVLESAEAQITYYYKTRAR